MNRNSFAFGIALTLALVPISWAERPSGSPTCEFSGGAYYKSNNTLYLESINNESARVDVSNVAQRCVNSYARKPYNVIVERNSALTSYSTIVLPLNATLRNSCAQLYMPTQMGKDRDGNWSITAKNSSSQTDANRPMLMMVDTGRDACLNIKEIEFSSNYDLSGTRDAVLEIYNSVSNRQDWSFVGTYSYVGWKSGDSDLGRIYGYAAKNQGTFNAGQFVKVGAGATIAPLRAYLKYTGSLPLAKSVNSNELPETIDVKLVDDEEEGTTRLVRWNTVTGEITKVNGWFDLNGRKLDAKPENKGMFVGKKTIKK